MGKGSNIKGLGSSWMSKHARNLLQDMPIDNRASGRGPGEYGKPKGPGKHHPGGPMKHGMMHDGPGEYGKMKGPGKHGMHKGMAEYGKPKGPGKHGYGPHMEHGDGPAQFIKLPESTKQKFRDLVNPDKYKGALTQFKNTISSAFKGDDPTSKVAKSQAQQGQSQINRFFNQ